MSLPSLTANWSILSCYKLNPTNYSVKLNLGSVYSGLNFITSWIYFTVKHFNVWSLSNFKLSSFLNAALASDESLKIMYNVWLPISFYMPTSIETSPLSLPIFFLSIKLWKTLRNFSLVSALSTGIPATMRWFSNYWSY